jgi:hypothetical protein
VNTEHAVPEFMRAMLGDQNFLDLESICTKLTDLEERGAISSAWHSHIIGEIADELVTRQIANEMADEALTADAARPDTPDSCGH